MSLSDDVKTVLEADATLMALLTGGVHNDVEEISRQNTASAFDSNNEILPCALIKLGVEIPRGPYIHSVQSPLVIYFYQRQGFDVIAPAMVRVYGLLHDQKIGSATWRVEFDSETSNQRDDPLDCALGTQRFVAVRSRAGDAI